MKLSGFAILERMYALRLDPIGNYHSLYLIGRHVYWKEMGTN